MVRARRRGRPPLRATDGEEDADTTEDEDLPESSLSDLAKEADPEAFDRSFLIEKEDVPTSVEESVPIPQPWQGIQRAAVVFNFNYVYDEAAGEWVREKKSRFRAGTVDANLPGPSADDGWDTAATADTTVTFDEAFSEQPAVVIAGNTANGINFERRAVTQSDFVIRALNYGTTDFTGQTLQVSWFAAEPTGA